MVDVRRCTLDEFEAAPNLYEVLEEYACESEMRELGRANPQPATYRALEASGMLHPIGAFEDDMLVGFILPIVVVLPHYGVVAATVESFFVPKTERDKGVGLRLLCFAEEIARGLGAKALLLSAPVASVLSVVMRGRKGYRRSNEVFVRALV